MSAVAAGEDATQLSGRDTLSGAVSNEERADIIAPTVRSRAELVGGVQRGDLVAFGERRIVEDRLQKVV